MLSRHLFQVQYEVNSTIYFMVQSLIDLFPAFLVVSLTFCLLDLSFPTLFDFTLFDLGEAPSFVCGSRLLLKSKVVGQQCSGSSPLSAS